MQLITTICDPCYDEGTETRCAKTRELKIDRKVVLVDVCPEHDKAIEEVNALFFKVGRRPEAKPPKEREKPPEVVPESGRVICTVPGCGKDFKSESGMRRHVTVSHAD